jgi:hypothetical protein
MTLRRVDIELSVEREMSTDPARPGPVARLSARFRTEPEGADISTEEIAEAIAELRQELDRSLAKLPGGEPRADRDLTELVETYRPRQQELVDLLRDEGDLTEVEYGRLTAYLGGRSTPAPRPMQPARIVAPADSPGLAAAPLANDRAPSTARPVESLIEEYQILSLKQAGAVRARRQISYDEYMALKQHFTTGAGSGAKGASSSPT